MDIYDILRRLELETSELLARVQALEAASLATTRPDSQ